jgi:hypothetical protein
MKLTEFLELRHRVFCRRWRRGIHLLLALGPFFLAGPPALLAMLNRPSGAPCDGANGGYTGDTAE